MFPQLSPKLGYTAFCCCLEYCPATGGYLLLILVTLLTAVMSTTTEMPTTTMRLTPTLGFLFVLCGINVQSK